MPDGNFETTAPQSLTPTSQEKLKQFVARIERVEEDQRGLAQDKKEIYAEAKTLGFDTTALRATIKFRSRDKQEIEEEEQMLELYLAALGDI